MRAVAITSGHTCAAQRDTWTTIDDMAVGSDWFSVDCAFSGGVQCSNHEVEGPDGVNVRARCGNSGVAHQSVDKWANLKAPPEI